MNGTVKWYNVRKGYGFIKGDDEEDYFVHYTQVPEGTMLREEDRVTFDAKDTERGKQALNILLGGGDAPAPAQETEAEGESADTEEKPVEEAPAEESAAEPEAEEPAKEETTEEKPVEDTEAEAPAKKEAPSEKKPAAE